MEEVILFFFFFLLELFPIVKGSKHENGSYFPWKFTHSLLFKQQFISKINKMYIKHEIHWDLAAS